MKRENAFGRTSEGVFFMRRNGRSGEFVYNGTEIWYNERDNEIQE